MTIANFPTLNKQLNQWQSHLNDYGPRLTANSTHKESIQVILTREREKHCINYYEGFQMVF